jgi:hypothetical protein
MESAGVSGGTFVAKAFPNRDQQSRNMRAFSSVLRLLLLPLDLLRMLVLALRISFWHLRVIIRFALFRNTSGHSFCHPLRRDHDGVRVSLCPFALRFANPRLFSLLCAHCHLSERGGKHWPMCRRKGGGPASSVTLLFFGIIPVLIFLFAFLWFLHPVTDVFHSVESWFTAPVVPPSTPPAPKEKDEATPAAPRAPEDIPQLPPLLQPNRTLPASELPPPPLGYNPIERRAKATASPETDQ